MIRPRRVAAVALTASALLLSGCASDGLASLPLPAPGLSGDSYTLTAEFTNALNVPARAKVKLGGADVGELEDMTTANYVAVTKLRIRSGIEIPVGSTAELRSATPLGDIFVALKPPAHVDASTPLLRDGDKIGLDHTTSAATVEGLLASAAVIVNGGAVRNLTNTVNGLGKATGPNGEAFGDLISKTNLLLRKLNARSDQLDTSLRQTAQLAGEIDTRKQVITELMTAAGPATEVLSDNANQIADLADTLGAISAQLKKLPSIAGTDQGSRSAIADLNSLSNAFNDIAVHPDTSLAALNRVIPPVIKSMSSSSFAGKASVDRLVLGSMPDAGHQGDVGFHGPKRYDWANLVGSFKYTLWRLQERVVGKGAYGESIPVRPSPTEPGVIEPVPGATPVPPTPLPPVGHP